MISILEMINIKIIINNMWTKGFFKVSNACVVFFVILLLSGCGGGGENDNSSTTIYSDSFTLSVNVSGLNGTLELQNNTQSPVVITSSGSFQLSSALNPGSEYNIVVHTHPSLQFCEIMTPSGIINNNVTVIDITCTNLYSLSGNISGLTGSLSLTNNSVDELTLNADGEFTFNTLVENGTQYNVTLTNTPADQICNVSNGTGTASQNISNIEIICIDTINKISSLGSGQPTDLVIHGDIAYVSAYSALHILDISDSSNPISLSLSPTPTSDAYRISKSGNYIFLSGWGSELLIFDVTQPANPVQIETFESEAGSIRDFIIRDSYAYLITSLLGLLVLDISNPAQPHVIGTDTDAARTTRGLALSGDYLFTINHNGMDIINIATLASPQLVANYPAISVSAQDIVINDSYAYIADQYNGIKVIDISNPLIPVFFSSYDSVSPNIHTAKSLTLAGNNLYVGDPYNGIHVIDVSSPETPTHIGIYTDMAECAYVCSEFANSAIYGNYLLVADYFNGLHVIDVSSPSTPNLIVQYNIINTVKGLTRDGNYIYVATSEDGLRIVDVTDTNNPATTGHFSDNFDGRDVAVSGNYAYVVGTSEFYSLDITDRSSPQQLDRLSTSSTLTVSIDGSYAYLSDQSSGLLIIDISDPSNLALVGEYDTYCSAWEVKVSGNYAYLADGCGLQIFNITDRTDPVLLSSITTQGQSNGLSIAGNYAYLASESAGLQIISISDPENPQLVSEYETDGTAYKVDVYNNYAFVADDTNGLLVFDISSPDAPVIIATYKSPGQIDRMFVDGNGIYIGIRESGLAILEPYQN